MRNALIVILGCLLTGIVIINCGYRPQRASNTKVSWVSTISGVFEPRIIPNYKAFFHHTDKGLYMYGSLLNYKHEEKLPIMINGKAIEYKSGDQLYVSKYNENSGELSWLKQNRPANIIGLISATTDTASNFYFLCSSFKETYKKEPRFVLSKYDPEGNLLWLKELYWPSGEEGMNGCITTDEARNIYLTGSFKDSLSIDGNKILASEGTGIMLMKLNENGEYAWAKRIDKENAIPQSGLRLNNFLVSNSTIYIIGHTHGSIKIADEEIRVEAKEAENGYPIHRFFIIALDRNGTAQKVRGFTAFNQLQPGHASLTHDGSLILTGSFSYALKFKEETIRIAHEDKSNIAIIKYNKQLDREWIKVISNKGNDEAGAVTSDEKNNIYIMGTLFNNEDQSENNKHSAQPVFISKYDTKGNKIMSEKLSIKSTHRGMQMWVRHDHLFFSGYFGGEATFGDRKINIRLSNHDKETLMYYYIVKARFN